MTNSRTPAATSAQLRALVRLRWQMVRSPRVRAGLLLLAAAVPALVAISVVGSRLAAHQRVFNATIVMPTAFLVYLALAVAGPLAAGGGNELFPADEVAPHPVRPSTMFLASLALSPLNIAWIGQTTALLALTGYVSRTWVGLAPALAMTVAYILAATTSGQAFAWGIAGLRQRRRGRLLVWAMAALAAASLVAAVHVGLTTVLDRMPTKAITVALLQGAEGNYGRWTWTILLLFAITAAALVLGVRTTAYTLRQPPGSTAERLAHDIPRRQPRPSLHAQLVALDRASVWRAPALRRGVFVMGLLPGSAAALAQVDWPTIALTTGLVTAGAGLLFGVNAFCLDGAGSLWLASTPLDPVAHIRAKAQVIAEISVVCGVITCVAAASRAERAVSLVNLATVVSCLLASTSIVVALCLRSSVTRPHRADLRGPRDTPAPPGAMAAHSARLATATTIAALSIAGTGVSGRPAAPILLAAAIALLSGRSILRTVRMYAEGPIRANVAITVAAG